MNTLSLCYYTNYITEYIKCQYFMNSSFIILFLIIISPYFFNKPNRTYLQKTHNILYRISLILLRLEFICSYYIHYRQPDNFIINKLMTIFMFELTNIITVVFTGHLITTRRIVHMFCHLIPLLQVLFIGDMLSIIYMYIHHFCDIMRDINGLIYNSAFINKCAQFTKILFIYLTISLYLLSRNTIIFTFMPFAINYVNTYDYLYGILN
ncbi:hypothetical protein H012_gp372 [Acanthamoeba polyphaga moumouvirus]|uniref:Uncharacterized protein n=2 Tax=Moumouvirus TaxID=3080801 RepID=L7RGC3_9VIRU|nr:hypothetical protein H012_gp372 [Acanthamoeba polyphaga moumouvirus]AEX62609.1 hypothetical protein mv_R404 [Moumouvirus Monve]AGC02085.1 hypothetical protein Moumou_00555 [Acanthamoeba polyphaga moumouvirus]AQN68456.1 hypothetical protein [Saudi moumouvirus]